MPAAFGQPDRLRSRGGRKSGMPGGEALDNLFGAVGIKMEPDDVARFGRARCLPIFFESLLPHFQLQSGTGRDDKGIGIEGFGSPHSAKNLLAGFVGFGHPAAAGDDATCVLREPHQLLVGAEPGSGKVLASTADKFLPDFPVGNTHRTFLEVLADGRNSFAPDQVGSGTVAIQVSGRAAEALPRRSRAARRSVIAVFAALQVDGPGWTPTDGIGGIFDAMRADFIDPVVQKLPVILVGRSRDQLPACAIVPEAIRAKREGRPRARDMVNVQTEEPSWDRSSGVWGGCGFLSGDGA